MASESSGGRVPIAANRPPVVLEDEKSSAHALVAFAGAAVLAVVLALAVSPGFWIAALVAVFLALAGGSAYEMSSPPRRIVFGVAIAAGAVAFVAGALIAVGAETAGAVMAALALLSVGALLWVARVA
jgi:hypothetical protein